MKPNYHPVNKDGLLAWYSYRNTGSVSTSGTWKDYSGSGRDQALAVNADVDNTGVSFDGTSYATGTDAGLPTGNASRSVVFWAYPTNITGYKVAFMYGTQSSDDAFAIGIDPGGDWYGTQEGSLIAQVSADINTWQMMALTFDSSTSTWTMYKNGEYGNVGVNSITTALGGTLYLGRQATVGNYYFVGKLEDFMFFDRVLSAGEIKQNYIRNFRG